ncbi:MAG: hypothetical protein WBH50_18695, partial [Fuerstiella sp.]
EHLSATQSHRHSNPAKRHTFPPPFTHQVPPAKNEETVDSKPLVHECGHSQTHHATEGNAIRGETFDFVPGLCLMSFPEPHACIE